MHERRSRRESVGVKPKCLNAKTPRTLKVAALVSPSGRATEVATLTVIGTLRPTERRRAMSFTLANVAPMKKVSEINDRNAIVRTMELRGIEPLTSAVRLQRSPS